MMLDQINRDEGVNLLQQIGLDAEDTFQWLEKAQTLVFGHSDSKKESLDCGKLCLTARDWLEALPLKTERESKQEKAGSMLVRETAGLCWRFTRAWRKELFQAAERKAGSFPRLDALAESAAELCPGIYPSKKELLAEQQKLLRDKDGLELHQGMLFSQWFSDPELGQRMIRNMRRPTEKALELQEEIIKTGKADLKYARVEIENGAGKVYFSHPEYLNAEDDITLEPAETAIDLALLHPEVKVGVLRGDPVSHPKYSGRRLFSSGINLTRLYQGTQSYLFYLTRELGLVNKLFRGHCGEDWLGNEIEHGHEIPWIAVVEGFAIGGGCQLLLVMDYVLAESGSYLNLPARKEGIIPGCANMRLPRMTGQRLASQAILFDRQFPVDAPESRSLVNEVFARNEIERQLEHCLQRVTGSGLVSAAGNRKALRAGEESLEVFRAYMAQYAYEQAFCHLSPQLVQNLEYHWNARERSLKS